MPRHTGRVRSYHYARRLALAASIGHEVVEHPGGNRPLHDRRHRHAGGAITARAASQDLFEIVGSTTTSTGTRPFTRSWYTGVALLPTLGGANGDAYGASGNFIVGRSQLANGRYHATSWHAGVAHDLGTLGGAQSVAYAMNG